MVNRHKLFCCHDLLDLVIGYRSVVFSLEVVFVAFRQPIRYGIDADIEALAPVGRVVTYRVQGVMAMTCEMP